MTATLDRPETALPSDGPTPRASIHPAVIAVVLTVIATHFLALGRFPTITADEGGWPLAVRTWVTTGHATFDYYQAPAYHWALGLPFYLFGGTVAVARVTSAVVSVLGLVCFAGVASRLFEDRRAVLWAVLLLGTDYAALCVDRRALMEPFELLWMNALVFCYLGRSRRDLVGIAVTTAGLLLTKASGAFILVALVLSDLTDRDRPRRQQAWTAMALGVGAALMAFVAMYATHPSEFLLGWGASLHGGSVQTGPALHPSAMIRLGFIVLDPVLALTIVRSLALGSPFAFALGTAGSVESLVDRRTSVIGWWFAGGLGCNLIQAVWLENHIAVVYPALVLGMVSILLTLDRTAERHRMFGMRLTWASVLAAVIVLFNLGELLGGIATTVEPSRGAMRWLGRHARPTDVVLAAPYITMQWTDSSHAFWELNAHRYVPTPDVLADWHVRWLVVDHKEWASTLTRAKSDTAMRTLLAACCTRVYPDGNVSAPPDVIYERITPDVPANPALRP